MARLTVVGHRTVIFCGAQGQMGCIIVCHAQPGMAAKTRLGPLALPGCPESCATVRCCTIDWLSKKILTYLHPRVDKQYTTKHRGVQGDVLGIG